MMMTPELTHYLRIANRGFGRGASSGEAAAATLARAVCNYVPSLDDQAQRGLVEFLALASFAPTTARDLIPGGFNDD